MIVAGFAALVQEAKKIAEAAGTWPFHAVVTAESHAEVVGFLRFMSEGFEHVLAETPKRQTTRRKELKARIGLWRRVTRWVLSLDPGQARGVAEAVLRQLEGEPYYVPCGHPWLTEADVAPRKPGRQRVRALAQTHKECTNCGGFGWL
jgi:hypothetical protein